MGSVGDLPGSPSYAAIFSSDGPSLSKEKKAPSSAKSSSHVHLVKRDVEDPQSLEETGEEASGKCAKVCLCMHACVCMCVCACVRVHVCLCFIIQDIQDNMIE